MSSRIAIRKRASIMPRLCAALAAACLSLQPAQGQGGHVYYATRPEVMDLSDPARLSPGLKGAPIALGQLPTEIAQAIQAAAARAEDAPEMVRWLENVSADDRRILAHENPRLSKAAPTVRRQGKQLIVTPRHGAAIRLQNWSAPETAVADGDSETFVYAGKLPGSGYQRVEVRYQHDAPGSALINPLSGKSAYVHNGSDAVALSPDGKRIVDLNVQMSPLRLAIASLDADGPAPELLCVSPEGPVYGTGLSATFKGWRSSNSLDVELSFVPGSNASVETFPLRLEFDGQAWRANAAMPGRLEQSAGLSCRQAAGGG